MATPVRPPAVVEAHVLAVPAPGSAIVPAPARATALALALAAAAADMAAGVLVAAATVVDAALPQSRVAQMTGGQEVATVVARVQRAGCPS